MYEKVKKFKEFICKNSSQAIILLVFTVIFIFVNIGKISFNNLFCYPEGMYQVLEEEASNLIRNNSFETNYDLVITNYNFSNKTLSMELSCDTATLDIEITNYGLINQEYNTNRDYNSAMSYILTNAFMILFISLCPAAFLLFVIIVLVSILQYIAFIIHKISKKK